MGRRITLMITGVVFSAGSLIQVLSFGSTAVIFVGRAIGGLVSILVLGSSATFDVGT
jgi:hypothetical protein